MNIDKDWESAILSLTLKARSSSGFSDTEARNALDTMQAICKKYKGGKINGSVVDLTGACSPLKGSTTKRRALASQEILIIEHVPPSAIRIVR